MFPMKVRRGLGVLTGLMIAGLTIATSVTEAQQPLPIAAAFAPAGRQNDPANDFPVAGLPSDDQIVAIRAGFTPPGPDRTSQLFITAMIRPKWHTFSITQPLPVGDGGGPTRTKLSLEQSAAYQPLADFQPDPQPNKKAEPAFDNLVVETHQNSVTWYAPIRLAADADSAKLVIPGLAHLQACLGEERCEMLDVAFKAAQTSDLPPVVAKRMAAASSASPGAAPPAPAAAAIDFRELLTQLGLAFLGGLILNLMPCVLPVISLKILSFLDQAGESRGRVFTLNLWYCAGLMSVFMVLAVLAATMKQAWGEQFTLPWFKVALTGTVFAMALSFLGVWEIPIPGFMGTGRANELQAREGASGAFFKGVFATLLATPCSGPFLGPIFGYLLTQSAVVAYCIFASVGLGMATPYLIVGAFPDLIRFLPKPGAWMETLKQFMAFLLLGTVVYLFSTLSPSYFIPTLTFLVGVWFGAWLIGRTPITVSPQWRAAAWAVAVFSTTLIGAAAFTVLFLQPKMHWQPFSPDAVVRARQEGKTVMIDFSANWCLTCQLNLKSSIETEKVRKVVEENGVVTLLADWTDRSPTIKQALNELGCNSIPQLVIYSGSRPDEKPVVLSDLIGEGAVIDALKKAGPSRSVQSLH
jgi:thiol:disulfide interchange protein